MKMKDDDQSIELMKIKEFNVDGSPSKSNEYSFRVFSFRYLIFFFRKKGENPPI